MVSEKGGFYDYYESASQSAETMRRSQGIYEAIAACMRSDGVEVRGGLQVADIGCGAGAQSIFWAAAGNEVHGIDINGDLVELARERAGNAGASATFVTGSAAALPWATGQFDVCIVPELLEHVEDWQKCLDEVCRVLKPGGYLFLTTTNRLCPRQDEFGLVGYSWYPGWLKRWCLQLARSSRKEWVKYAEYPAINWFSPYELRHELRRRGCSSLDRFDVMTRKGQGGASGALARVVVSSSLLRFVAHCLTPYTLLVGRKDGPATRRS